MNSEYNKLNDEFKKDTGMSCDCIDCEHYDKEKWTAKDYLYCCPEENDCPSQGAFSKWLMKLSINNIKG